MNKFIKNKLSEIIRVDHAGEYGARIIYDGQIAAFKIKKDYDSVKLVKEMKSHEEEHYQYFNDKIRSEKIRPTIMHPIWKAGGFALGFLTAIIDKKSAMVCTTAVEEVIDDHYSNQLKEIEEIESKKLISLGQISQGQISKNDQNDLEDLKEKIAKFRNDEVNHKNIAYQNNAADFKFFLPLSLFIKSATKLAILISKKI
jgi:ubiquinone biosynthesis monooxygenase Coq7